MIPKINAVIIENVYPELDGGRYFVKRFEKDLFKVEADIITHGHDIICARLLYRKKKQSNWHESKMQFKDNDRWQGTFVLNEIGFYEYTIFAWRDSFLTWVHDTQKKHQARLEITSELLEGKLFVQHAMKKAKADDKKLLQVFYQHFNDILDPEFDPELQQEIIENKIFGSELALLMENNADRSNCGWYNRELSVFVNRKKAEFSSWYEMWHRSQGTVENQSATFADMEKRLPEIQSLGFDVIYLPPIHPVGRTNRKGPNNSLICPPGSPGCPYAIGNENGGHTAIEPSLGTMDDFIHFEKACRSAGMEIALDFAIQVSPDHPWVKEHPQWFNKRPDGTIKYAENPPKKYEDIYPINFDTEDKEGLWNALLEVIRFWISKGVKIFRVDNPHTKPFLFWEWLIAEIHCTDPGIIFLSEAFTRPKIMKNLAKIGFTQSYTYFTWRNFKHDLIDYFKELTATATAEYMLGNLFTNTPDILPWNLQNAPPPAFKVRAALAATLSSSWGIYNGFELCENTPLEGKEEYLNSEKYQYKVWDWDRPGNIKYFIRRLNMIRKNEVALQSYKNLQFYHSENDNILFYIKRTEDQNDILLIFVNLDPYHTQDSFVYVPIYELGINQDEPYEVYDLISKEFYYWTNERNYVKLDPEKEPVHILKVIRFNRKEDKFDYY